jgi:hypothetical protein
MAVVVGMIQSPDTAWFRPPSLILPYGSSRTLVRYLRRSLWIDRELPWAARPYCKAAKKSEVCSRNPRQSHSDCSSPCAYKRRDRLGTSNRPTDPLTRHSYANRLARQDRLEGDGWLASSVRQAIFAAILPDARCLGGFCLSPRKKSSARKSCRNRLQSSGFRFLFPACTS